MTKLRCLVVGAAPLPLAVIVPGTAWAGSFTVSPVNSNDESLSISRHVLYDTGGYVEVLAGPAGGTSCTFTITSEPALSGLPVGGSCGTPAGASVDIPANSGTKRVAYTFLLQTSTGSTTNGW
jgi:hypothetical protein